MTSQSSGWSVLVSETGPAGEQGKKEASGDGQKNSHGATQHVGKFFHPPLLTQLFP